MKILIANDDGIKSPVLPLLAKWAMKLGDVTIAAPKVEQSGKSQAIQFIHEIEITEVEIAPQNFKGFERKGFTVIEWGGSIIE